MFQLPDLDYDYSQLEPFVSAEIMQLHHSAHHQTYVDKLNEAIAKYEVLQSKTIEDLVTNWQDSPEDVRNIIRNHGGGHYNHSQFWKMLTPNSQDPEGEILQLIISIYQTLDNFKIQFEQSASTLFGSGWTWLLADGTIVNTANQDNPLTNGQKIILGLDVWEHAYYLQYKNKRADYIKNWWNIVNWNYANNLLVSQA